MKANRLVSVFCTALLLSATAMVVSAQTDPEDHEAHHPPQGEEGLAPAPEPTESTAGMPGGMPGMGMMTPEMMQMMQQMMGPGGMMGRMPGRGMPQGAEEPGMMGSMMQMMGGRPGMGMHGMMGSDAMLYGMPHGAVAEMTPERVRTLLEHRLQWHGNPRLKLGEISTAPDGSITAEIVTVDGSLVQKLAFNRYPGLFRQLDE